MDGNYTQIYREAVEETIGSVAPIIYLPAPNGLGLIDYTAEYSQLFDEYTIPSPLDLYSALEDAYNIDNTTIAGAGHIETLSSGNIAVVTLPEDNSSFKSLIEDLSPITESLYGTEEMWASFVGAHEAQHYFNTQINSMNGLTKETDSDHYAVQYVAEKYELTEDETALFAQEVAHIRAIASVHSATHITHVTELDSSNAEEASAGIAFSNAINDAIALLEINPDNSHLTYGIDDDIANDVMANIIITGVLPYTDNPHIQELGQAYIDAYNHFQPDRPIELTEDYQQAFEHLHTTHVFDGNGHSISTGEDGLGGPLRIGRDLSDEPRASADPKLFQNGSADEPATSNMKVTTGTPTQVLQGEFTTKVATTNTSITASTEPSTPKPEALEPL